MKRSKKLMAAAAALGMVSAVGVAQADVVSQWDMSLTSPAQTTQEVAAATGVPFTFDIFNYVEPGSLTDPNTGAVASGGFMPSGWSLFAGGKTNIFTDSTKTTQNGAMTWKERDTQGPGINVVTGDDVKNENCIMSAGWMPESPWGTDIKQCSDPWQSSKRFKMVSYVLDGPADRRIARDHHDLGVFKIVPHILDEFQSVCPRHLVIGDDQIHRRLIQKGSGLLDAAAAMDHIPRPGQVACDDFKGGGAVIHGQNCRSLVLHALFVLICRRWPGSFHARSRCMGR